MAQTPAYLLLGQIQKPHGVRGELRFRILTDYPERLFDLDFVFIGDSPESKNIQEYEIENIRMHKDSALLQLAEIQDRNQAEFLRDLYVMIDIENAVPLEDDEVYLYQLIGLTVQTEEEIILGQITDVLETGANDVYVVKGDAYGEILIPVLDETILKTNIENGTMIVRLPDGLLPS